MRTYLSVFFFAIYIVSCTFSSDTKTQTVSDIVQCEFIYYNSKQMKSHEFISSLTIDSSDKNIYRFQYISQIEKGIDKTIILDTSNDSLIIIKTKSESNTYKLLYSNIIISDTLTDKVYLYETMDAPIDGETIIGLSLNYGLILWKSKSWKNFYSLSDIRKNGASSAKQIKLITDILHNNYGFYIWCSNIR